MNKEYTLRIILHNINQQKEPQTLKIHHKYCNTLKCQYLGMIYKHAAKYWQRDYKISHIFILTNITPFRKNIAMGVKN
jgi:hypothetical protein